ncbi:MAG: hypothetical protein HGA90_06165 [Alphaproteobacteria bacterium]|nr:hypothetical protein [Alphaproteobacteria bacterium]
MFCILPLTAALAHGLTWLKEHAEGREIRLLQFGWFLLIAPLPMLVYPALVDNRPFITGLLLFPVAKTSTSCDMRDLGKFLGENDAPRLILNEMDSGSELLFRTPHRVLAAPYHTNVSGNLDSAHFFQTTDPVEAKAILERRGIDKVAICRKTVPFYKGDGVAKSMAERLADGTGLDGWKKVDRADFKDYVLFEKVSFASP